MNGYAVELRTVYGKRVWHVLDMNRGCVVGTVARCDSWEAATLVCNALTAQNAQECAK